MKHRICAFAAALVVFGCGDSDQDSPPQPPEEGVRLLMDFANTGSFYAAPFPSDHRVSADGTVSLGAYPSADIAPIVVGVMELLDGRAQGFGVSSGIFLPLDAAIDPGSLPNLHQSVDTESPVFLVDVDQASPEFLRRYPITTHFAKEAGLFGAPNLLSVLPLQGVPLRPDTRHAVVLTRGVYDLQGRGMVPSAELLDLVNGKTPAGLDTDGLAAYRAAVAELSEAGLLENAVGLSVFTTGDATQEMHALVADMRARPLPTPLGPFVKTEEYADYCVYQSSLELPVYQQGEPPYSNGGGNIVFDGAQPVFVRTEEARILVTVPRLSMPAQGFPTAVMVRSGGGGDRPLVDRGVHATAGAAQPIVPGSGPGLYFAKAGFAGVSVDGPHGGFRNITGGDEQFLIFNFQNPAAMLDNLRQSSAELARIPDILAPLSFDATDCPGFQSSSGTVSFDLEQLALMGHSIGATLAPVTLAAEPRYRYAILSGAGGSWIENVVHKRSPLPVKPIAESLLGYTQRGLELHAHDPFLNLLQWAGESADPPVYARSLVREPEGAQARHILMLQGIVDTYILPPIANATSLSIGLDLAGDALDTAHPKLQSFTPLGELLRYSRAREVSYPVESNASVTAVVVQHAEDGVEDGHEVVFQTDPPKRQYRCFLQSALSGSPVVLEPSGDPLGACP